MRDVNSQLQEYNTHALIDHGFSPQATPSRVRGKYRKYLRDVQALIPRSTLYEYRKLERLHCKSLALGRTCHVSLILLNRGVDRFGG